MNEALKATYFWQIFPCQKALLKSSYGWIYFLDEGIQLNKKSGGGETSNVEVLYAGQKFFFGKP